MRILCPCRACRDERRREREEEARRVPFAVSVARLRAFASQLPTDSREGGSTWANGARKRAAEWPD